MALSGAVTLCPDNCAAGTIVLRIASLQVSYVEIYCEKIRDLLDTSRSNLQVCESCVWGGCVSIGSDSAD